MKNIVVVGLGLIGGSLASALRGFEDYNIMGVDIDRNTRLYAEENKIGDIITDDTKYAVNHGDIVICCLYPKDTIQFLQEYKDEFMDGALVLDVCGIKTGVMEAGGCLGDKVDFIGTHPMAGKERGGIVNSTGKLFYGSHYIITPRNDSREENIELLYRLAKHIGCSNVIKTTPEKHDAIIAYTSQTMHIMAVSVVDDPALFECQGFEGGSFRDCTRVAALEPEIWTELFTMNAQKLSESLRKLEDNLREYREVIEAGDSVKLMKKLQNSSDRKRSVNLESRRGDDVILPESSIK